VRFRSGVKVRRNSDQLFTARAWLVYASASDASPMNTGVLVPTA
jgi:hypothetical protein